MIEDMEQVHMTDSEVTSNFAAVLEKLKQGAEVVVEQDHRAVAVIRPPHRSGRQISDASLRRKLTARKSRWTAGSPPT